MEFTNARRLTALPRWFFLLRVFYFITMGKNKYYAKTISIEVDIDMSEIDSDDMIDELERRGVRSIDELSNAGFRFETKEQQLAFVKKVLGLQVYHSNDRVLSEIKELLQ